MDSDSGDSREGSQCGKDELDSNGSINDEGQVDSEGDYSGSEGNGIGQKQDSSGEDDDGHNLKDKREDRCEVVYSRREDSASKDHDSNAVGHNTSETLSRDDKCSQTLEKVVQEAASSDVATGSGHHLCDQPVPSTFNPTRPIGGSISTNTTHVSGGHIQEFVRAFAQRGEQASYDTRLETIGPSHNDVKEVHFHLTKTDINNPSAIALGGQVLVHPPQKRTSKSGALGPRPPTEMQKLRGETEASFAKWTKGMVKTGATRAVLDKISEGRTWITITGSPGEGKTTAGYLVLEQLHSMGRQVYEIKSPDDYFKVKESIQPVLMLNDIFGALHFDMDKLKKWEGVLIDILAMKEHKIEGVTDRKKLQLTVIMISRSSVLNEAANHLGRFREIIMKKECVVNLTHGQDIAVGERIEIWKHYAEVNNIRIDDKIVKDVCKMSLPHGFPHCCRLFAAMYATNKHLSMKSFFSKPLEFLDHAMTSLMAGVVTGLLLREMLKHDGSLDLDNVTDDERRFQYASIVETLRGTYLSEESGIVTFRHPSVYDSAALVACKKDPKFVIQHCSLSFLNDRVTFSGLKKETQNKSQQNVTISSKYTKMFLDRLESEFEKKNLSLTLSHKSFHDEGFVSEFMQRVLPSCEVQPLGASVNALIQTRDKTSNESFLFLMTKSTSDKILRYICQFVELSQEEKAVALFGICQHTSVSAMEYFQSRYEEFNFDAKDSELQTPLLLAATKCSENTLKLLLERDVDVNAKDKKGNTALHNLCRYGVDGDCDVVKTLIDKGASVNMDSPEKPYLPLHIACYEGHTEVVTVLLDSGADVNQRDNCINIPPSAESVAQMMHRHLMESQIYRRPTFGFGNPFQTPSNLISSVLGSGSESNNTNRNGHTALIYASIQGHVDIVTILIDRGADVNRTDKAGDTPLMHAGFGRHVDVMKILIDRGADIDAKDRRDMSLLLSACYFLHEYEDVILLLIEKGADINMSSRHRTPLAVARANNFLWKNAAIKKAFLGRTVAD